MAIRHDVSDMVEFLNSLVALDPYFVQELLSFRVPCNEEIAHHPTVQVAAHPAPMVPPGQFRAGVLGVLNGFLGSYDNGPRAGWGPLAAVYENGKLIRFEVTKNEQDQPLVRTV